MPGVEFKNHVKLKPHHPEERLRDRKFVVEALVQSLKDGDAKAFKEILQAHLEVVNKAQFAAKARISRRTLFRILSPKGNPTLENIARLVRTVAVS